MIVRASEWADHGGQIPSCHTLSGTTTEQQPGPRTSRRFLGVAEPKRVPCVPDGRETPPARRCLRSRSGTPSLSIRPRTGPSFPVLASTAHPAGRPPRRGQQRECQESCLTDAGRPRRRPGRGEAASLRLIGTHATCIPGTADLPWELSRLGGERHLEYHALAVQAKTRGPA